MLLLLLADTAWHAAWQLDSGRSYEDPRVAADGDGKPQRRRRQIQRGPPRLHTAERAESRRGPQPDAEETAARRREARRQEEARGRELAGAGAMRLTPEERQMRQLANLIDVLRQAMAHRNRKLYGKTVRDWKGVFALIDRDGKGSVTQAEFKGAMNRMGLGLSDQQVGELMLLLDPDGSGEIEFHELQRVLAMNWGASGGAPAGTFGTPRAADAKAFDRARADVASMLETMEEGDEAQEQQDGAELQPRQYATTRRAAGQHAWSDGGATTDGEKMVVVAQYQREGGGGPGGAQQRQGLEESSVTVLGAQIAEEEMALQRRVAELERDRRQLEDRKSQQQLRRVERNLRSHATTELRAFEGTVKTELDGQIDALNGERAEKLSAVVNFQNDLREKVRDSFIGKWWLLDRQTERTAPPSALLDPSALGKQRTRDWIDTSSDTALYCTAGPAAAADDRRVRHKGCERGGGLRRVRSSAEG